MGSRQSRQDQLLHLQADDANRGFTAPEEWDFDHDREARLAAHRRGRAINGAHTTFVDAFAEAIAVDDSAWMDVIAHRIGGHCPWLKKDQMPNSTRYARMVGSPHRRIFSAAALAS